MKMKVIVEFPKENWFEATISSRKNGSAWKDKNAIQDISKRLMEISISEEDVCLLSYDVCISCMTKKALGALTVKELKDASLSIDEAVETIKK